MEKIILTKEKLSEIINDCDNKSKMEFYYDAALKNNIIADQYGSLLCLLLMFVRHYHTELFLKKKTDASEFFGLNLFAEGTEYWRFYELLDKTNFIILMCKIHKENIPDKPLEEFTEIYSHVSFLYGHYIKFLDVSTNAFKINPNNSICIFLKSLIVELCFINKTPLSYKIALRNYQKQLIEKCTAHELPFDIRIYNSALNEINSYIQHFGEIEQQIEFTPVANNFKETQKFIKEWTEEHDFYLRNCLFLNPLCNFGNFVECSIEDLEDLPTNDKVKNLFNEIVDDFKMCRSIVFSFYKKINGVGKREMCMTYSYLYSIFDKLAYLFKIAFNLKMNDDHIDFTKEHLFNAPVNGTKIKFGDIKNNNISPLYTIMKKTREKQKITNALQTGTFKHNELRNAINHKSIYVVSEQKLKTNSSMLLRLARDAILYSYMLLHSCSAKDFEKNTAIHHTYFSIIMKANFENNQELEKK